MRCAILGEVQRFDAEPVTAEQHPAAVALDDREGEHALEVFDEPVAPAVVRLEQDLGVAVGEEAVAVADQLTAQVLVVVDTAVPADGQSEFRIDHGLSPGLGQIDDFQAAVTKRDPALGPHTRRVRTPGRHRLGHGRDRSHVRCLAVETHLAGGSTHLFDPTSSRVRRFGPPARRVWGRDTRPGEKRVSSPQSPMVSGYPTPSSASPVSSTCLIGPVNQCFTEACQ